jgi:hypothetical protein
MVFFFIALVFMYVGRKIGWALSKAVLYTASPVTAGIGSAIWGVGVALSMFCVIRWQEPNIILKIIMGYALGWYVAIPNFGLLQEGAIPEEAKPRHLMISTWPTVAYLVTMMTITLLTRKMGT